MGGRLTGKLCARFQPGSFPAGNWWASCVIMVLLLARPLPAFAHGEDHASPQARPETMTAAAGLRADITEKLGDSIPSGLVFVDSEGDACELDALLTLPTILVITYYGCTAECNPVLENLALALREIPRAPGQDYRVLSLSFDQADTAAMARRKRDNVMQILGPAFPRDAWRFLTGDARNITTLTEAVGFHFFRQESSFAHSAALVFIAPGGKIVRYLHGTQYLPAEISLALTEAETGRTGGSIRKMLSYCFSYDPASRSYSTVILRVAGLVVSIVVITLFVVMLRPRRNGKKSPEDGPGNA